MAIRDILVQFDTTDACPGRLDLAIRLAVSHGARLVAMGVIEVSALPGVGEAMINLEDGRAVAAREDAIRRRLMAAAAVLQAGFEAHLAAAGVAGAWRLLETRADHAIVAEARAADLVILGQRNRDDPASVNWTPVLEHVLMDSGRPVLVVPASRTFTAIGSRVLVGWNGGREAARALHDALPLMGAGASVTVLAAQEAAESVEAVVAHLVRHGLDARGEVNAERDGSVGLLRKAADLGADLVVTGGYGHSRLREAILGGVTRNLLQETMVPLLMSH